MVFNRTNSIEDPRDLFCNAVTKIFGDSTTFLDFLENEEYSTIKYDCFLDYDGENYIINRETGEYINWYKLSHIGRSINISTYLHNDIPKFIEKFLIEFKESSVNIESRTRNEIALDELIKYLEEVANSHDMIEQNKDATLEECKCIKECRQVADWLKELRQLREHERWIPVSERLPEKNIPCLVSVGKFNLIQMATYSDLMGIKNHRIFYRGEYGHENFEDITQYVNAWKPFLLEPYKEESEDKDNYES